MEIDITICKKQNVTDSCAFWNILSSPILQSVLLDNKFDFACTEFVVYECLTKPRTKTNLSDDIIKEKFKNLILKKQVTSYKLSIEDLQDDKILKARMLLGKGELSSIAFAKKVGIPFHTDDQGARKIAKHILGVANVQTTPLMVGWLFYKNHLLDSDLEAIIVDHKNAGRPLAKYFREVHVESYRIKMQERSI